MKFGVRNGCLRQDWDESFGTASWLGFDGVELDVPADYAGSLLFSQEGRRRLQSYPEGTGVEIAAFCLGALWTLSPADERPEIRHEAVHFIQQSATYSGEVNCPVILVPITPGEGATPEAQRQRWIAALKECAPVAEEAHITLALENVYKGCGQSARAILDLLQAVRSPAVKAYYDFGNAIILHQDPVAELKLLGTEWIRQLHAKDPGGRLLGEGRAPFPEVAAAIWDIGYDGYIVLETDATEDPEKAAAHNLNFLKSILG